MQKHLYSECFRVFEEGSQSLLNGVPLRKDTGDARNHVWGYPVS